MKDLMFNGIIFDDWCEYEEGENGRTCLTYWAEMCESCAAKYHAKISKYLDDGSTARAICSVKACNNSGEDAEKHYYIDFPKKEITFVEA